MTAPDVAAPPRRPRRWGRIAGAVGLVAAAVSPWWGPPVLRRFAFFRIRRVEVHGAHTLDPSVVVQRLHVDTTVSLFADLGPLTQRVSTHPQVKHVVLRRRLPGTLVVDVEENAPIALVPRAGGFQAFDSLGRGLPVDPSRIALDVPIVAQRDTAVFALLARVRGAAPEVFAQISEVRRVAAGELLVAMGTLPVRVLPEVTPARLAEILPVAADLARRGLRAQELDLRYRDQVIARLP